jgi:hypothetical protein
MQVPEPPREESSNGKGYKPLFDIGEGGMGVATLALARGPEGFAKLVVLKRLHAHLLTDPDSVQMLLDEARVSARLSHQNVVQVYEAIVHRGAPTIVMEYLEGQPLTALLSASTRLPLDVHLVILAHALRGLDAAHDLLDYDGKPLNLVHRDMSPHNVFVGYDGQVKVLDFGIAKIMGSEGSTKTGILKGKLRYMSPEQVSGRDVDRRSDVFSMGIMLWEAISARRMWKDASDGEILRRLLNGSLPELNAQNVAPRLVEICTRALAIDPGQRYPTAGGFRRELQAYLDSQPGNVEDELTTFLEKQFRQKRDQTRALVAERIGRVSSAPPERTITAVQRRQGSGWLAPARGLARPWLLAGAATVLCMALATVAIIRFKATTARASETTPAVMLDTPLAPECEVGLKACDGQCVSTDRAEYGCGSASCAPCSPPNATPRCSRDQVCDIAVCYRGYDNCDGLRENGCEVLLRTDPNNCGACSDKCAELPHAQVGCGDSCQIWRCDPGFEDCNGVLADGCEAQIGGDSENCGACGVRCGVGRTCKQGRCAR